MILQIPEDAVYLVSYACRELAYKRFSQAAGTYSSPAALKQEGDRLLELSNSINSQAHARKKALKS